ncbi:hypothetical protein HDU91_000093 [Kappamyces sp. JEL0680]|nr:hypothetical protein HDU91_000093 [Kappamyces sp. JEL0680]
MLDTLILTSLALAATQDHEGVLEKQKKSAQGITLPVLTFGSLGLLCILLFCVVKPRMKDIYTPRRILSRGRPPSISYGLLSWIPVVFRTEEQFLINTVGLDGVMLLRFFKLGYTLFFFLSIIGLGVLAPLNYHANPPTFKGNETYYEVESILLPALSIDNIPFGDTAMLRIILVFCWIITFCAIGFLFSYYRGFISLKLQYDEYALKRTRMSKIEMRTVMVFGVPRDLRSEINLSVYFENLGIGKVENVVLCRNWSLLQDAVQKRGMYLEELEKLHVWACKMKLPTSPTTSGSDLFAIPQRFTADIILDSISSKFAALDPAQRPTHRTALFKEWDARVSRLRKSPENSAPTAVAFVTFESPMSATIASQSVCHTDPFSLMVRMAPEPRDIFWNNLSARSAHNYSKFFRSLLAMGIMFLLVTSTTFVVSSIAALIDLKQLAEHFPFLQFINDLPPSWVQFIQGIIPPSLLAAWNSLLPSVLIILCHLQGLEAESWIQHSLLSKYFFYQLYNVIIVIPLANTLVWKILINPQQVIERLGEMLPKSSTTLLNLIILQGFAVYPAQLLLAAPLFLTWMARLWSTATPRQISNAYFPSILTFINYGIIIPVPVLVFIIGIMYAQISPIILPFCCIFFAIGYFVTKYILMYVHFPDYESKGAATTLIINRCLTGMALMQFTMMGVLALKAADKTEPSSPQEWSQYAQMVIGILPLPMITFLCYTLMNQAYKKQIRNVPLQVLGKVQKSFSSMFVQQSTETAAPHVQEMGDMRQQQDSRLLNRLSLFSSHSQPQRTSIVDPTETDTIPDGLSASVVSATGLEQDAAAPTLRHKYSMRSILDPEAGKPSPFHNPADVDPQLEAVAQHDAYDPVHDVEGQEDERDLMAQHWEPPMTRIPGILNIPLGASMLKYGEQDGDDGIDDDAQLHSYYHPALVGKLPVAWLEGVSFAQLRKEQERDQRLLLNRLISQQRLAMEHEEDLSLDEDEESGVLASILRFVDGFTSWTHLSIQ